MVSSLRNGVLSAVLVATLAMGGCGDFFVSNNTVQNIAISPASVIIKTGTDPTTNRIALNATAITVGGSTSDVTSTATWTTGNDAIATVAAGVVTAGNTAGFTTITAKDGGTSGTANVIATNTTLPTSLTVTPQNPSLTLNSKTQFTATVPVNVINGSADITSFVSWSSSNTAVATVNSNGLVTAVASCGGSFSTTFCPTITATVTTATNTLTAQSTITSIQ